MSFSIFRFRWIWNRMYHNSVGYGWYVFNIPYNIIWCVFIDKVSISLDRGKPIRAQLIIYSRANNFSWSSFLFQNFYLLLERNNTYMPGCSIWYCSKVSPHHLPVRPEANLIRYYFLHTHKISYGIIKVVYYIYI